MISFDEFKKELDVFYRWMDSLIKDDPTPEEEEEWKRIEKQSNMSK